MNELGINAFLEKLGLTEYESKTLSTLFKLSEAEAPEVSRLAQVPKTRVYDVLDKLVKKKLVIEIRGRPKKYRVIDSHKALEQLVEKRKGEIKELEEMAKSIKEQLSHAGKSREEYGEAVMKVKDRHDFEKILGQEIEHAKDSIIGFTEISDKNNSLKEALQNAGEKKVGIKLLNAFPIESVKKTLKDAELKHHEHGLNAVIIDGKKIVMGLSDFKRDKPEYHFTIWHENKPLVNALSHYFEKCWKEGK